MALRKVLAQPYAGAVSYTHLDVYKRQAYESAGAGPDRLAYATASSGQRRLRFIDVYKRQLSLMRGDSGDGPLYDAASAVLERVQMGEP